MSIKSTGTTALDNTTTYRATQTDQALRPFPKLILSSATPRRAILVT